MPFWKKQDPPKPIPRAGEAHQFKIKGKTMSSDADVLTPDDEDWMLLDNKMGWGKNKSGEFQLKTLKTHEEDDVEAGSTLATCKVEKTEYEMSPDLDLSSCSEDDLFNGERNDEFQAELKFKLVKAATFVTKDGEEFAKLKMSLSGKSKAETKINDDIEDIECTTKIKKAKYEIEFTEQGELSCEFENGNWDNWARKWDCGIFDVEYEQSWGKDVTTVNSKDDVDPLQALLVGSCLALYFHPARFVEEMERIAKAKARTMKTEAKARQAREAREAEEEREERQEEDDQLRSERGLPMAGEAQQFKIEGITMSSDADVLNPDNEKWMLLHNKMGWFEDHGEFHLMTCISWDGTQSTLATCTVKKPDYEISTDLDVSSCSEDDVFNGEAELKFKLVKEATFFTKDGEEFANIKMTLSGKSKAELKEDDDGVEGLECTTKIKKAKYEIEFTEQAELSCEFEKGDWDNWDRKWDCGIFDVEYDRKGGKGVTTVNSKDDVDPLQALLVGSCLAFFFHPARFHEELERKFRYFFCQ